MLFLKLLSVHGSASAQSHRYTSNVRISAPKQTMLILFLSKDKTQLPAWNKKIRTFHFSQHFDKTLM